MRQMSQNGLRATFSCDPTILENVSNQTLEGVLYFAHDDVDEIFKKVVQQRHFSPMYKWLVIGKNFLNVLPNIRYDADITYLEENASSHFVNDTVTYSQSQEFSFCDVHNHPRDGFAIHPWAYWSIAKGFILTWDRERILRRKDLKKYPLRIATPIGHYSNERYNGTFVNWLDDESIIDQDPGIRCGYHTSMLLVDAVNGQQVLIANELWADALNKNSSYVMVSTGEADLSGGVLRMLLTRFEVFDYIVGIWPFRVGFTYLAKRESSKNMYLEPFSPAVWWACLAMMGVLALVQRITSKSHKEQDGAFYTVLTTYLQQDASAVPEGASGRWSFIVLSVSAMLVHAYYTSAIVSALMSTGKGGPDSLKALGDSKYSIACEDYDYMRYLFFDVKTSLDDLEYLKNKKKTSKFYTDLEKGVELIRQGNTAFHTEYNQIYPHFKTFSDDQICKLQHVDTIPQSLAWVTSPKDSQWREVLRIAGMWLFEVGLGNRLVKRLRIPQPQCRAALLAERVKLGDVAPLLLLTVFGALLSLIVLGIELMVANAQRYQGTMMGRKVQSFFEHEESY